jgi:hypothetical protein
MAGSAPIYPDFVARLTMNLSQYQEYVGRLQLPGGVKFLPAEPQRMYHPVKGQLTKPQNAMTLRELESPPHRSPHLGHR